jgi:SAM-dependent methyltransferase
MDLDADGFGALGGAFMSAKLLCIASEIDLFGKLASGPLSLEELSGALNLPRRSVRVVANAMAALGVLVLEDGKYKNTSSSQEFLTGQSPLDVRAGLRLYNRIVYPMWMGIENAIRTGEPARHGQTNEEFARIFSEGVEAWTRPGAVALSERFDFSSVRRLLDVGGGTGSYLIPILERYPDMRATLYELPPSAAHARKRLGAHAIGPRVDIVEGDALFDPIPEGHDAVLMAGFIHLFNPEKVLMFLKRAREAVKPGTPLLVCDQWMNSTHTSPMFGAMLAGTYLMLSGEGDTYSVDEARPWFEQTGWQFVEHRQLTTLIGLVVVVAK